MMRQGKHDMRHVTWRERLPNIAWAVILAMTAGLGAASAAGQPRASAGDAEPVDESSTWVRRLYSFEGGRNGASIRGLMRHADNVQIVTAPIDGVTHGKKCALVRVKAGVPWAGFTLDDKAIEGWGGYAFLALDVYTADAHSYALRLELTDATRGPKDSGCVVARQLHEGRQTLLYPIDAEVVDLSALKRVKLSLVPRRDRPVTLCVDNIRLLRAEAGDVALLFSTLGYDANATKRALVRSVTGLVDAVVDVKRSSWVLLDVNEEQVADGSMACLPSTYGTQLWVADFSSVRQEGFFRLVVTLKDATDAELRTLATLPFEIGSRLHVRRTATAVGARNAAARSVPGEKRDAGFCSGDGTPDDVLAHGLFLGGLVNACERWDAASWPEGGAGVGSSAIPRPRTRKDLAEAAVRAADYLMTRHDPSKGESGAQRDSQSPGGIASENARAQMAVYGLASFAAVFKDEQADRAAQASAVVRRSMLWLETRKAFPPSLAATVACRLYAYGGDPADRRSAITALDAFVATFAWPASLNETRVPCFEGLYRAACAFEDEPKRVAWIDWAGMVVRQHLRPALDANGFNVFYALAADVAWQGGLPPSTWKAANAAAPDTNVRLANLAAHAVMLAQLTGDRELEKMATAALGWITGLHPGVRGEWLRGPASEERLGSAALISGLDARHVTPCPGTVWRPAANGWMSLVNGLTIQDGRWVYADWAATAQTSIANDGAYLTAIALYDAYMAGRN